MVEPLIGPIVGIDLGTTYSCVAVMKDGKIEIVPNSLGKRSTPSVVSYIKGEKIVGHSALYQKHKNEANTIYDSKRMIGKVFSDPEI